MKQYESVVIDMLFITEDVVRTSETFDNVKDITDWVDGTVQGD